MESSSFFADEYDREFIQLLKSMININKSPFLNIYRH